MKGLAPLFLGIFGTFAFSWFGLTVIPTWQIGHLNPESDEEGTDIYPQPQSGMFERGAQVYAANGCMYCHTQQVRADYAGDDIERGWGTRRSAPRDYIFERPVFLGKMRMGQDIANIGTRAPATQASPSTAGAASPVVSFAPGTSPGTSPAPVGSAPAAASPAAQQNPSPATQGGSPPPAGSPAIVSSSPPASSPPTSPASVKTAAASPGASPPAPPTGLASPSPGAIAAGAVSTGAQPGSTTASSSGAQTAGPAWPIQTMGEPPMYSAAWHHVHLYSPRSINLDSNMPAYRFLYHKRRIAGERSAEALHLTGSDAPPEGWEVVPSFDAQCLVAYLMALNQSHPLKDVRSVGAASPPAGSPSPAAAASPAPAK